MRDAQNEEALVRPDIDDPVVADPQTPKTLKLTPQWLATFSSSTKLVFQTLIDSRGFLLLDPPKVPGHGGLVLDLICQAAFSVRRRR